MSGQRDNVVERLRASGVKGAGPVDLLAVAFARRKEDASGTELVARETLKRLGSIVKVADSDFDDLHREFGLEEFETLRCMALIELGRRAGFAEKGKRTEVEVPEDVYELLQHLKYEKQEHFYVVLLDAKNVVMQAVPVHVGTLSMSIVGPREVFRPAVRAGASSIIVAHNHPSGDPTPSPEDLEVTKRLVEIGKQLDIPVQDHVIIGDPASISFMRRGLL